MSKLVVFDLDDTLYPERSFVLSGFRAVGEWMEANGRLHGFYGRSAALFELGWRKSIFDRVLEEAGIARDAGLVAEMVGIYRNHAPRIALFDDARWALQHLASTNRLGLITDGFAATQRNKIEALDIGGWFDPLIVSDELGPGLWKPSPAPYLRAMDASRYSGSDCVYVGDNPKKDFVTANRLGWLTIRIRRESGEHRLAVAEPGHEAHLEISSLLELESRLPEPEGRGLGSVDNQLVQAEESR